MRFTNTHAPRKYCFWTLLFIALDLLYPQPDRLQPKMDIYKWQNCCVATAATFEEGCDMREVHTYLRMQMDVG